MLFHKLHKVHLRVYPCSINIKIRINNCIIVTPSVKGKFIDAIQRYSVDAGCVVVVSVRAQSSNVKHDRLTTRW